MKPLFAVLIMSFSYFAVANSLSATIESIKNQVNQRKVAKAILCAETGHECTPIMGKKPVRVGQRKMKIIGGLGTDIKTLERALLATDVYGEEDMERILNAIDELERRKKKER